MATLKGSRPTLKPQTACLCLRSLSDLFLNPCIRYCSDTSQCQSHINDLYRCQTSAVNSTAVYEFAPSISFANTTYGLCAHKPLFSPFSWRDILTVLIVFAGSMVAAGAGVGGGALNVAMLVFIDEFTATSAIPLSSVWNNSHSFLALQLPNAVIP